MTVTHQNVRNGKTRILLMLSCFLVGAALGLVAGLHICQQRNFAGHEAVFSALVEAKSYDLAGLCSSSEVALHPIPSAPAKCEWLNAIDAHPDSQKLSASIDRFAAGGCAGGAGAGLLLLFFVSVRLDNKKGVNDDE